MRLVSNFSFSITLILLAFTVCGAEPIRFTLKRNSYEEIPLRRSGENRFYTSGKLNGRRSSFLIDTGWSLTTVATNLVKVASGSRAFCDLSLGDVAFTNQSALSQEMQFNGQRAPFDVVLGMDFLRAHFALLDCAKQRLYVRRVATSAEEQSRICDAFQLAEYLALDLNLKTNPPAITIVAQINDQPLELLVDSGAAWTCLDSHAEAQFSMNALPSTLRISGTGNKTKRNVGVARVNSFRLGEIQFNRAPLAVLDLADWNFAAPNALLSEVRGILGNDYLMTCDAMIDCHALKLWVKTPASRAKRVNRN